jgi:hypothetical protein
MPLLAVGRVMRDQARLVLLAEAAVAALTHPITIGMAAKAVPLVILRAQTPEQMPELSMVQRVLQVCAQPPVRAAAVARRMQQLREMAGLAAHQVAVAAVAAREKTITPQVLAVMAHAAKYGSLSTRTTLLAALLDTG